MSDTDRQAHWENVYTTKAEKEVSWFQENPAPSLDLIALTGLSEDAALIDIGGGASRLVDDLISRKFSRLTVLDLSGSALAAARKRLGDRGADVQWVIADVTKWEPTQTYDLWHDRAAFHFLTHHADQSAYVDRLKKALKPGGYVIIGTFAPDGPERCSGLPIVRHDATTLAAILGNEFVLIDTRRHDHATPWDAVQRFQFSTFRRAEKG
jgi:2-polyprenyl-3-methyl-5-hydroxy-6-metoxy-1,4-benzoquinol methylase